MKIELLKPSDARLRQKCTPYAKEELMDKAKKDVLDAYKCIGRGVAIALPQVGIMKRGFVTQNFQAYFNCSYVPAEWAKTYTSKEGCLSDSSGKLREVTRFDGIVATWTNKYGELCTREMYAGYDSMCVIFQHECDHLDGKLIFDNPQNIC